MFKRFNFIVELIDFKQKGKQKINYLSFFHHICTMQAVVMGERDHTNFIGEIKLLCLLFYGFIVILIVVIPLPYLCVPSLWCGGYLFF